MNLRITAVLITSALAACSKAPSCSDRTALQLLSQNGYAKLQRIVTISASASAENARCRADNGSIMGGHMIEYRVFRSSDGNVVVEVETA